MQPQACIFLIVIYIIDTALISWNGVSWDNYCNSPLFIFAMFIRFAYFSYSWSAAMGSLGNPVQRKFTTFIITFSPKVSTSDSGVPLSRYHLDYLLNIPKLSKAISNTLN